MKKLYRLQIKVYQPAEALYIPFWMPPEMVLGKYLITGYHEVDMFDDETTAMKFFKWASNHEHILKVIGADRIEEEKTAF